MKEGLLKGARSLLEHHKKVSNQDTYANIIVDTNRLEKEFFEQDDDDNSYNMMSELEEMKNTTNKGKKGKF